MAPRGRLESNRLALMRQAAWSGMPWPGIRATVALAAVVGAPAAGAAPAQAVIVYRCGTTAVNLCQVNSNGSGRTQLTSEGSYEDVSLDPAGTRMVLDHGSSLYAANGSAQDPVGPISNASSLAKISSDGSTGVDDERLQRPRRGSARVHLRHQRRQHIRVRLSGAVPQLHSEW